jgi:hypothetical protein
MKIGTTATNPETQQRVVWDGNKWVPLKTATNPETGAKIGIFNGNTIQLTPPPAPPTIREQFGEFVSGLGDRRQQMYAKGMQRVAEQGARTGGIRPDDAAMIMTSQAIRSGAEELFDFAGSLIPNSVKEGAEGALDDFLQTRVGKATVDAVGKGYEFYNTQFKQRFPVQAERFESLVDITALFSPRPDIPKSKLLEGMAKQQRYTSEGLNLQKKKEGVYTLLEPSSPELRDVFDEVGPLRKAVWRPDEFWQDVSTTVAKMPGVNPNRSYYYNYGQVQNRVNQLNLRTDALVLSQNKPIDIDDLVNRLQSVVDDLKSDKTIQMATGDAQKQAFDLAEEALSSIQSGGGDLASILTTRRAIDKFKGSFDNPTKASEIATSRIRTVLNDVLKQNTKGDELHRMLEEQFHGLTAMDRMLPKRAVEAKNGIARFTSNLKSVDLLPSTVLGLSATAGVGVGVLGGAVPVTAGVGMAGGLGLAIMAFKPRRRAAALSALIGAGDKALQNPGKLGVPVLRQIEMDRLLLIDMLETTRQEMKDEPQQEETND